MLISNSCRALDKLSRMMSAILFVVAMALAIPLSAAPSNEVQAPLQETLKSLPFKIAYECYVNNNWEIFVMNPDGSGAVNLTDTPDQNEHYPQISHDGSKISFTVDEGIGRETVRSLYVMDIDGKNRKKLADHAREQFWSPDSKIIGFLPQEYP